MRRGDVTRRVCALLAIVALTPLHAQANTMWPFVAYYMQQEFVGNVWTISIGLTIEFFVVWKAFAVTARKALAADIVMNLASTLIGLAILYGLALAGFSVLGEGIAYQFKEPVQFTLVLAANFAAVCLMNALIEGAVLKWVFKLPLNVRNVAYLLLANALSAAVSLVGLWIHTGGEPWVNPRSLV